MRYHYQVDKNRTIRNESIKLYKCDHPLYNYCTLFKMNNKGLAVVQRKFNSKMKISWWDCIDFGLANDIFEQKGFKEFLESNANIPDQNGLYPTMNVRKVMWALRMKPLKKEAWESDF